MDDHGQLIVGIDAAGINSGGGLSHLVNLLAAAEPRKAGVGEVVLWCCASTGAAVPRRPFLRTVCPSALDGGIARRMAWQRWSLPHEARRARCDVMFVPGGTSVCGFHPIVGMSQNMLPFQREESRRFGLSAMRLKMELLRLSQGSLAKRADGYIYLTEFARERIRRELRRVAPSTLIPHGIAERFRHPPRSGVRIESCSSDRPFRLLYVSMVDAYKHHPEVAEAVAMLGRKGLPIRMEFVGPHREPYLRRLLRTMDSVDPDGRWISYVGPVPNSELHARYAQADLVVFASSCENLPIIMLEAMASGRPVASSGVGPMPEVLGEEGHYFDPDSPRSIADCVQRLVQDVDAREKAARLSHSRSETFTWERCADLTFAYLAKIARPADGRRHTTP
jgi:glycosyltransferase involved in cell wall biosynthesis